MSFTDLYPVVGKGIFLQPVVGNTNARDLLQLLHDPHRSIVLNVADGFQKEFIVRDKLVNVKNIKVNQR